MSKEKELVITSPKRKQLGGFWFIFSGIGCFFLWLDGNKTGGDKILLGVAGIIFLMGVYRVFTHYKTTFISGKVPSVTKETYHFGFHKKVAQADFNEISLLRRENILPYCQLYAFSSLEFLKTRMSPDELRPYESGGQDLPGVVIIDHATKKECERFNEKIWRFYDMWDETQE